MAARNRHHGRPGTRVIPHEWATDHAAVVERTLTGTCTITRGVSAEPVFNPSKGHSATPDPVPYWDGPCRVQVENAQETQQSTGDATVLTRGYLVVVPTVVDARVDDVVQVTAAEDPSLAGTRLAVRAVAKGTLVWERDLTCVEIGGTT